MASTTTVSNTPTQTCLLDQVGRMDDVGLFSSISHLPALSSKPHWLIGLSQLDWYDPESIQYLIASVFSNHVYELKTLLLRKLSDARWRHSSTAKQLNS